MCVASYGVMPQAYSVATGPAAARTSSPVAVSCSRGAGPLPGSTGTSARRQDSMFVRLSCVSGQAIPASTAAREVQNGRSDVREDRVPGAPDARPGRTGGDAADVAVAQVGTKSQESGGTDGAGVGPPRGSWPPASGRGLTSNH